MKQEKKIRVLFFAWGDSIHVRRRIGIFTADPSFKVGVISTFAYNFKNAQNYYLSNATCTVPQNGRDISLLNKLMNKTLTVLFYLALRLFRKGISLDECYLMLRDARLVRRHAREFKPDIIFLQTLLYPNYLSFLLGKMVPAIITFWNGDVTWWAKWNGIERAFKRRIVLHGVKRAQAITVNSKAALEACLGYGVNQNKVKLIRYPGVNLEMFNHQPYTFNVRERLNLRQIKIVLCPRGLGDYLNSDVIIEAAAIVIKHYPDTLFLFLSGVGTEALWKEHMRRAEELGIAENIRRDGQVSWEKMPMYYHAADVMVSVSSNDSLPNCMLESMACGVPVVMGDIPQIQEWIKDGYNGFLVPPRDPVLLAERIMETLANKDCIIANFVQKNIEIVSREADSRIVAAAVKALVRNVAIHGSAIIEPDVGCSVSG
ncbi:MAG: glycosyltransferase family 4 protein [Dissulfurispiraceae bacterium]